MECFLRRNWAYVHTYSNMKNCSPDPLMPLSCATIADAASLLVAKKPEERAELKTHSEPTGDR